MNIRPIPVCRMCHSRRDHGQLSGQRDPRMSGQPKHDDSQTSRDVSGLALVA
jgi:hypothetical protein